MLTSTNKNRKIKIDMCIRLMELVQRLSHVAGQKTSIYYEISLYQPSNRQAKDNNNNLETFTFKTFNVGNIDL